MRLLVALAERAGLRERHRGHVRAASGSTSPRTGRCSTSPCVRPRRESIVVDGEDVVPDVHAVLDKMARFAEQVRSGRVAWAHRPARSATWSTSASAGPTSGRPWPTTALRDFSRPVADVPLRLQRRRHRRLGGDPRPRPGRDAVHRVVQDVHAPLETLTNAHTARDWLVDGARRRGGRRPATSWPCPPTPPRWPSSASTPPTCSSSGTGSGGRYSFDSAIGLSLMIAIGPDRLPASSWPASTPIDEHFRTAPFEPTCPRCSGLHRRLVRQLLRRRDPGRPALQPVPRPASRPTSSSSTWRATASRSTSTATRSRLQTGPDRLGPARHQRPARLLPADPPGHPADPVPTSSAFCRPEPRPRSSSTTTC